MRIASEGSLKGLGRTISQVKILARVRPMKLAPTPARRYSCLFRSSSYWNHKYHMTAKTKAPLRKLLLHTRTIVSSKMRERWANRLMKCKIDRSRRVTSWIISETDHFHGHLRNRPPSISPSPTVPSVEAQG